MRNIFPARLNIYQVLLGLLILLSLIPIIVLITQSINNLDSVAELSNENIEITVKQQTVQLYKAYAQNLAQRLSDFLHTCELAIEDVSKLDFNPELYLRFSKDHQRWVNSLQSSIPIYKEIAFIDKNGAEVIKIVDNKILSKSELKNVSYPENTMFRTEDYFAKTKASASALFVSHLNGWYVSRQEQLEQGKSFSGVIRFCKKLTDDKGNFAGMFMLALDHRHIMDFIWHAPMDRESLLTTYKTGNYNYIIDDEGWIIAHPKNWDIRGLDKNGVLIEPLTENTPRWKFDAGLIPINLQKMDWRLHDIYTNEPMSSVINRVQRGETVITTMKSMGIYGESEGIIRTRAYAPIRYDSSPYDKHGIFGAVVIGTSLEEFSANTRILTGQIETINTFTKKRMLVIAAVILIGVIFFSFFVAKLMARPM
ncbi:MAG: cache domain-containing protein, partial [bacterium]